MPFVPFQPSFIPTEGGLLQRSQDYLQFMNARRSLRDFSDRPVSRAVIETLIQPASSTAPSGAHKQSWTFCLVGSPDLKRQQICEAAEAEVKRSDEGRMSDEWLADLSPRGTGWRKPFLATAPWQIIVFRRSYELEGGRKRPHHYVMESVEMTGGFLLPAIHNAGLVTLTHTSSPMDLLTKLFNRSANEKPFLLLPVGYPAPTCWYPIFHQCDLSVVLNGLVCPAE